MFFDNPQPHFNKEWDVPFSIKYISVPEQDGTMVNRRVVFIDKPIKRKVRESLDEKLSLVFISVAN